VAACEPACVLMTQNPSWTALLAIAAQHWLGDYRRTPLKRAFPIRSDYEEHLI
jgi:hypothetical protein